MSRATISKVFTVPEEWVDRVRGGMPSFEPAQWGVDDSEAADGALAECQSSDQSRLAFAIFDQSANTWRLLPCGANEDCDDAFFARRVRRAIRLREQADLIAPESGFRLLNGEGDNLSGFYADVFAGHAIVWTQSPGHEEWARRIGRAMEAELGPHSIISKVRPTGDAPTGRLPHLLLHGEEPPSRITVVEHDLRYEIHLLGGLNTGLFCDMRDVRGAMLGWCKGRSVLNTFAYTGSFSLVAARAGAQRVTSVELAGGVVEWMKTNFHLNEMPATDPRFHFVKGDVFDFLKAQRRKDKTYDLIILDPPASTQMPGRRWFLKSDYDRLIAHALRLLSAEGLLLVAATSLGSRPEGIENQIRKAAKIARRRLRLLSSFTQPIDFPTQLIHPASRHLKCFLLMAD